MKNKLFLTTNSNHVDFLFNGKEFSEKFISCIQNAKKSIHLQTYIFDTDDFGKLVLEELIAAKIRGVEVFLIVDAIGSKNFSLTEELKIKNVGINFYRFNNIQLKWVYRWGRRLHHKVLLIDQISGIVGGINIHNSTSELLSVPILDFAVYLEGPLLQNIYEYCIKILKKTSLEQLNLPAITKSQLIFNPGIEVGISVNDWAYGYHKISSQYSLITNEAKKEILIINSYFFPRKKFMKQLVAAAKRGVRVRLILPADSDWPSYILASEFLYAYFLKNGVEIYQWKKSVLHGKLAIVDDKWVTVGSFNLNYTSYQQNLEINVNIYSKDFTDKLIIKINELILNGCDKIDPKNFEEKTSIKVRFQRFFYYIVLSLVANFSIGLTFQENKNNDNRFINIIRVVASIVFFILGIIGVLLPIMPGIPFFILSFSLIFRQLIFNKKKK